MHMHTRVPSGIRALLVAALTLVFCGKDDTGTGSASEPVVLTGQWVGKYGEMSLRQVGDSVYGFYLFQCGQLGGTLAGSRLTFDWWENAKGLAYDSAFAIFRGQGYFDVVAGGDSLDGEWWPEGDSATPGTWTASRILLLPDSSAILDVCSPGDTDTTTDTTDAPDDTAGNAQVDSVMPVPGMLVSTNPDDDLVFQIADSGGEAIFYRGRQTADTFLINHLTVRDSAGVLSSVILHEYLPVQWIMDGLTMAVYNLDDGFAFDPSRAVLVHTDGQTDDSLTLNLYPSNLDSVVERMERLAGRGFPAARRYLIDNNVSQFSQLTALVESSSGNARLHAAAAATGFALAHVSCALSDRVSVVGKQTATAFYGQVFKTTIKVGAAGLGALLGAEFGPGSTAVDGPTVSVFLCQGAAKYGVCHYMFFYAGPQQIGPCISFCYATLGCFTNICMPMAISWTDAAGFNSRQFGQ